jgi:hypothetical protein
MNLHLHRDIYLQTNSSTHDWSSNLCHGTCNEEASRDDTYHRSEGKDGLNKPRGELIGCHSNGDGSKDDLCIP